MRSWHDYQLSGYRVDGEEKEVSLSLRPTDPKAAGAEVVFSGVADYFFEHDLGINIVFAIEQSDIEPFIRTNATVFKQKRKWGWPRSWKGSVEETVQHLKETQMKLWTVSTSYGLSGWVLALKATENARAA